MADPAILLDAFKLRPAAAIKFLARKGYAVSWNWYDTWREAHIQSFTVAKVTRLDVLQDIRSEIDKALKEGTTFSQFKKTLTPRLQEKGWWGKKEIIDESTGVITEIQRGSARRLKTIYQTNLQTSYMAGRYQQQQEAAALVPNWQYISIIDAATTERCRSMHLRIFRSTDPVWNKLYPPNHWGCRARVRALTDRQVARGRYSVESSEGRMVTKEVTVGKDEDKKTVQVTGIKLSDDKTYWPDPGWDYNPGKTDYKPDLSKYDADLRKQFNDLTGG